MDNEQTKQQATNPVLIKKHRKELLVASLKFILLFPILFPVGIAGYGIFSLLLDFPFWVSYGLTTFLGISLMLYIFKKLNITDKLNNAFSKKPPSRWSKLKDITLGILIFLLTMAFFIGLAEITFYGIKTIISWFF